MRVFYMRKLWYENAFIYHFFTFGVCNAPFKNPYGPIQYRIYEIEKWIPHLKKLNVNAVLFSPVFESRSHGYDTTDYYQLDSRIGDNESFLHVIDTLHNNGIRVILDGVFNHCGRDFFAFQDLLTNGRNSKYREWFAGLDFSSSSPLNDPFSYATWNGYYELPKFNLNHPEVVDYLLDVVSYWISYFHIDGLRLDAADCLTPAFMCALRQKTIAQKEDFWLMGEVVHGDYRNWVKADALHSVTNYEIFKGLYSSHNDQNLFEIAHSLHREFDRMEGRYGYFLPYNFVDNHDQNRLASLVEESSYLYTIYLLLFTIPGIPSLYYGSEWGIKGEKTVDSDLPIRPYLDIEKIMPMEDNLENVIQTLSQIRMEQAALFAGDYKQVSIAYQAPFVFERRYKEQQIVVVINATQKEHFLDLSMYQGTSFFDLLNKESIPSSELNHVKIHPSWGRILLAQITE
ncbi:MAG: cyclomaltodextrinase / maltogenic alpha-amylase / neopullulanase [Clostridiales bacterium]|nr:cyclomaltodextrinase / maltogenic alpha-amylase / neopullulanase [Clostridiales bacterium]